MERFHLITLSVAAVALIITLTLAGIAIQFNSKQQKFPPSHDTCPTGWTVGPNGRCNNNSSGDTPARTPNSADWTDADWGSKNNKGEHDVKGVDICVKKGWANRNGIYWDGVTNYNGC